MIDLLMFFVKPTICALIAACVLIIGILHLAYLSNNLNTPIPKRLIVACTTFVIFVFCIVSLIMLL